MLVRKFEASTLEQALSEVKKTLGPDALVLSTEQKRAGWFHRPVVQVTAALRKEDEKPVDSEVEFLKKVFPHRNEIPTTKRKVAQKKPLQQYTEVVVPERSTRSVIYEKEFAKVGLSFSSARELSNRLILEYSNQDLSNPTFLKKIKQKLLVEAMHTLRPDFLYSQTHWAVIGAAGVGKTSAAVKLALWLRKQRRSVSLITLDRRKILAKNEMAAYARLIKVPFLVDSSFGNGGNSIQLIDTPAIDFQSEKAQQKLGHKCRGKGVILVIDGTSRLKEMHRVVAGAAVFQPKAILFTKLDLVSQRGFIYELIRSVRIPLLGASVAASYNRPFKFFEPRELANYVLESRGEL